MLTRYYKGQTLWLPEQVVVVAVALPQDYWYVQSPRYKLKKPHLSWKSSYWVYEFLLDRMIANQINYLIQQDPAVTIPNIQKVTSFI